ncbi:MAG: hypothetical protein HQK87_06605 [Nitrospinae bacterium]|nr:hypothetical protein [Nitrospinota bacterium]
MKGIVLGLVIVAVGALLGALSVLLPPAQPHGPPPGLTETTRGEQLKELERLRLQGIREAAAGEREKAMTTFLRLQYVNPHDPFFAQRMAALLAEMGEAPFVALLDRKLADRPDNESRDRILAAVYFQAGLDAKGGALADRFHAAHPDDVAAQFLAGAFARRAGDNKRAVAILTKVITAHPEHYYAYLELQNAYEALGDMRSANLMLGLALENSPGQKDGICCGIPPDPTAAKKPVDKGV